MGRDHEHQDHHANRGPVDWDEIYSEDGDRPKWSGRPNGALVAEATDLAPGTALDVACGEGADAIWLADRGWQVTAVDPSGIALDRARTAASRWGVDVTWVHAGLLDMPNGTGQHDLVTAQYPALLHTDDDVEITTLIDAVAPGGTLLIVHHVIDAHRHDHDGNDPRFDPDDYVMPDDVVAHLDHGWEVEVHETRPRSNTHSPETRHVEDLVLRARRTGSDTLG